MSAVVNDSFVRRPPDVLRPYVESYVGYHFAGFARRSTWGCRRTTPHVHRRLRRAARADPAARWIAAHPAVRHVGRRSAHDTAVIRHDGSQHGIQLQVTPEGARALFRRPAAELARPLSRSTSCGVDWPPSCTTGSPQPRIGRPASRPSTGSCCACCRRPWIFRRVLDPRRPRRSVDWPNCTGSSM